MATTSSTWNLADISDQTGRIVVVTGANSGLGSATVEALAGAGAQDLTGITFPQLAAAAKPLQARPGTMG